MNFAEFRVSLARRPRLAMEIALALTIKAVLMFLLWAAFFSQPPAGGRVTGQRVATDLFGSPSASSPARAPDPHGS